MHFRRAFCPLLVALTVMGSVACVGAARAGLDIDFGANVRVGDDTDLFLAISSRYFDRDPSDVRGWRSHYRDSDDCAVALFLASRARRDPDVIFRMRGGGMSWWAIGLQLGVPVDAWFVPVTYSPGPPFGKAYGHWRKHRRDHRYRFILSDREVCDLVAVRMVHDYYGIRPAQAMQWRLGHRDVQSLISREYRKRHGRGHEGEWRDDSGRHDRSDRDTRRDYRERSDRRGRDESIKRDVPRAKQERDRSRGKGRER